MTTTESRNVISGENNKLGRVRVSIRGCPFTASQKKLCVKRYILGISLMHKAKLKKILAGYPVETFIKGGRHQPIKLSNKSGKYLTFSSLSIGPLY